MEPKVKSIIAHITFIGWLIAFLINNNDKDEMTNFFLRQTLGIFVIGIIGSFFPVIRVIVGIIIFILWLMSLISAIQGETKEVPYLGEHFQKWFKNLV